MQIFHPRGFYVNFLHIRIFGMDERGIMWYNGCDRIPIWGGRDHLKRRSSLPPHTRTTSSKECLSPTNLLGSGIKFSFGREPRNVEVQEEENFGV